MLDLVVAALASYADDASGCCLGLYLVRDLAHSVMEAQPQYLDEEIDGIAQAGAGQYLEQAEALQKKQ